MNKSNGAGAADAAAVAVNEQDNSRMIANISATLARAVLAGRSGQTFDGKRDIYNALGYDKTPGYAKYEDFFLRGDIASNIVEYPALDTWRESPRILDGKDEKTGREDTPFVVALKMLDKEIGIFSALSKVDVLTGIGRYGVLVFGFIGGPPGFSEPITAQEINGLAYLRGFGEGESTFSTYVKDTQSKLYGMPKEYSIDFGEGVGQKNVHYSRVLHIVENNLKDRVFGRPRLERVLNRLDDLSKVVGGGAEAFWRTVDRGVKAKVDDGYNLTAEDEAALKEDVAAFVHKLQNFILTEGVSIESMGSDYSDPSGLFTIIVDLIAAACGIPKRILLGSERGELASSQDERNWNKLIRQRQTKHAEPNILRPVIDRLIDAGVLPKPSTGEYFVDWPDLHQPTDDEMAETAAKIADALSKLILGGGAELIDIGEFVSRFFGLKVIDLPRMIAEETAEPEMIEDDGMPGEDDENINP